MTLYLKINPQLAQWAILQATRILHVFAILQGLNILLSDPARWSSDSFIHALAVPGAPPTWGYVLLFGGVLATYGGIFSRLWALEAGSYICSAWSFFFGLVFMTAALNDAEASSLGALTYATFGIMFAGIAIVFKQSRKANSAANTGDPREP